MSKNLVIVESPTKARTLTRFLGDGFEVKATLGHVRDLPKSRLGVDTDRDFIPSYVIPAEKREVVRTLTRAVSVATSIYLATDPDREGEAISWHLIEATGPRDKPVHRVVFHEITPEAVREAFAHPREIDLLLVQAQQARRILDRLVGYQVSPLLWRKVRRGLSAGRVQSVAVRLIVDREREIQDFVTTEYWTIEADLAKAHAQPRRQSFRAGLVGLWESREKLTISNETEAQRLVGDLERATFTVAEVNQRQVQRQPPPPFITSTLQQEASRKLRFSAKRTMQVAQQLYEGIPLGDAGSIGLITYMRTDSTTVAASALEETRRYIAQRFGREFLPNAPRQFRRKVKGAQEAHEAIRPTSVFREPEQVKAFLSTEQFRLYDLIWRRMVASQMAAALFDTTTVEIRAEGTASGATYRFRATGSVLRFAGFRALYIEGRDEEEEERGVALPPLDRGETLLLLGLIPEQHFTQPPPRYTEATLIKALEEKGIGRPSTYAPILSTIQERGYVHKVERHLRPTELGTVVTDLLVEHFPRIMDLGFTARMEEHLDQIARGEEEWVRVLRRFYDPFAGQVQRASQVIGKIRLAGEPTEEHCEQCGRPMVIKLGRYGRFLACSGFPECRNSRALVAKTGARCPRCGGELVQRRSKRQRIFYGCDRYPQCDFVVWGRPLPQPCEACGGLRIQAGRAIGRCTQCGHRAALVSEPEMASVAL